jgi:hypothetical protein
VIILALIVIVMGRRAYRNLSMKAQDEDRILRVWTPVILLHPAGGGDCAERGPNRNPPDAGPISHAFQGGAAQRWRQGLPDIRAR